jgi:coenzyme F420-reducing hydrogenase delta subunit
MPENYKEPIRAIALFYCVNAVDRQVVKKLEGNCQLGLRLVKMPCSSMVKEVFLLRALEAGAEAVLVLVCPKGHCQFADGNIRASKRVERTGKLLGEAGLGGGRVSIYDAKLETEEEILLALRQALSQADASGIAAGSKISNKEYIPSSAEDRKSVV